MKQVFSKTNVCVTLTGEEWFAVLSRLVEMPLSKEGESLYNAASKKLQTQILSVSERLK